MIKIVTLLAIIAVFSIALSISLPAFAQESTSRCGLVTLDDKPLTLAGKELAVGDRAPEFSLIDADTTTVSSEEFEGRIMVISVMPSIDTPT